MKKDAKRVLIAMSGGVDSSTAAALLREQGYICGGAMLRLCREPEVAHLAAQSAEDARRTAERLGMDFYLFDETERFSRCVMEKFVAEYGAGRTPNPCIDCNRELKFGALLDRALTLGYDYIATGHYARVALDETTGKYRLLRGAERRKDQSYVLYQLTQRQLAHLLLPVGDYDKPAIRDKARQAGLDNADKGDSQDICFVPDGARPLVTPELFDAVVLRAAVCAAAAPAVPVHDTIKLARDRRVTETPDRSMLFAVQTPQVFDAGLLKAALQSALTEHAALTDDCSAVERLGKEVYLTDGDEENIKITTPLDLIVAEAILRRREEREAEE